MSARPPIWRRDWRDIMRDSLWPPGMASRATGLQRTFATQAEAVQRERFLKTGKRRDERELLLLGVAQRG